MKHPRMSKNSRVTATIPALSGGLNAGTDPSLIGDTQVSACRDMHWKDGMLRTREGFVTNAAQFGRFALGNHTQYFTDRDGYLLVLASVDTEASGDLYVTVFDQNGMPTGGYFSTTGQQGLCGFFVSVGNDEAFAEYSSLLFLNNGDIYGVNAAKNVWKPLYDAAYVPLYMTGGTPVTSRADTALTGTRVEPYNRLSDWFRCTYSTNGTGIYYYLPRLSQGSALTVTLTRASTTLTWTLEGGTGVSATVGGYQVKLDTKGHCFWFLKDGSPCAMENEGIRNDVTATAQRAGTAGPRVSDMRCATWYGGDRSAAAGGTRLFLGGGHHVMWSALNNPLYFPDTAYASLGDPDEAITAFGKQGECLLLFKEHSLYAAQYVRSDTVTVEDVESGAVTDTTATAVFPITPIHTEIGCDLPETVALLGNRLVWACADGTVYTLGTSGQLSQRTVTVISEPIRPLLRMQRPAVSAGVVIDGEYLLLWDNTLFVATDEAAPRWTRWSFDKTGAKPQSLCRVGGGLCIPAAYTVGGTEVLYWFRQSGKADTVITHSGTNWSNAVYTFARRSVRGCLCTKQFDLGAPDEYKRLTSVFADAAADGKVSAAYVTEQGVYPDVERTAHDGVRLTPSVPRCRRFALRLEAENLRVGSITWRVITGRR
ncbi:MAG: hypothetical protein IJN61_03840 [Clostridia bacterium]|nr:hypothetical protein [Clostridia bacterium]